MAKLFANRGGPDQTLHAASYLCLHCFPITLLGFPDLKSSFVAFFYCLSVLFLHVGNPN